MKTTNSLDNDENYQRLKTRLKLAEDGLVFRTENGIVHGVYDDTSGVLPGQMHHVNQDAAFYEKIPTRLAQTIQVFGEVFGDSVNPNSTHYRLHQYMERGFWDQFREAGPSRGIPEGVRVEDTPTVHEYNIGLYRSARYAGFNHNQSLDIVRITIRNQLRYGLRPNDLVPNVPGRIWSAYDHPMLP